MVLNVNLIITMANAKLLNNINSDLGILVKHPWCNYTFEWGWGHGEKYPC